MERPCDYNDQVVCDKRECYHCGWDPEVAQERLREVRTEKKLYRIPFTGFCEVWANSPEEAADLAEDIEKQFYAHYNYGDPVYQERRSEDE
jgi:hypothetical protein